MRITLEEQRELTVRMNRGDLEARDELIRSARPTMTFLVRQYANRGVDREDLEQEAWMGALRASEDYDPGRGVHFSTHAGYWINEVLRMAVMNHGNRIRVKSGILRKYSQLQKYLAARDGETSSDDIRRDLGFGESTLRSIRQCETVLSTASLSRDIEPADSDESFDAEERDKILRAVKELPAEQRYVVERTFGLWACKRQTHRDVGRTLGVTTAAVGVLKATAIKVLQESTNFRLESPALRRGKESPPPLDFEVGRM